MALDYLNEIKPLTDAGYTDAQVAAHFSGLYNKDAMATGSTDLRNNPDLLHILAAIAKVLRLAPDATWKGPLISYFAALPSNPQNDALIEGFELLLTQLQISGRPVFTSSNPETAGLTTAIEQIVLALVDPTVGGYVTEAVSKATGGLRFPGGLTDVDVAAARDAWQAAEDQRIADEAAAAAAAQAESEHHGWQSDFLGRYNSTVAPVLDTRPRDNAALVAALQALATDLNNNPWSP